MSPASSPRAWRMVGAIPPPLLQTAPQSSTTHSPSRRRTTTLIGGAGTGLQVSFAWATLNWPLWLEAHAGCAGSSHTQLVPLATNGHRSMSPNTARRTRETVRTHRAAMDFLSTGGVFTTRGWASSTGRVTCFPGSRSTSLRGTNGGLYGFTLFDIVVQFAHLKKTQSKPLASSVAREQSRRLAQSPHMSPSTSTRVQVPRRPPC